MNTHRPASPTPLATRVMGFLAALVFAISPALADTGGLQATFNSASDVAVTAGSYTATDSTVHFILNFAPPAGTVLTVVNNTGIDFIKGTFSNLAQGQPVDLTFSGATYHFVANYFGGTGNDLVLQWALTEAVAWGDNNFDALGNDSGVLVPLPTPVNTSGVLAGKTIIALATGTYHSLAVCSDGTLAAWGWNTAGALGTGGSATPNYSSSTGTLRPVAVYRNGVLAGKTVIAVSAGSSHSLALCSDGSIAAWGRNSDGQLGNNSRVDSSIPVLVDRSGVLAGKTVVSIAAGEFYSLALCSDGTVGAWGRYVVDTNYLHGTLAPLAVNASGVLLGKTVIAIAAGREHSMALCSDGTIAAWGSLGAGTFVSSQAPVAVSMTGALLGKKVTAVATGGAASLALCSDGSLVAWGSNSLGELGNGSQVYSPLPVAVNQQGVLAGKRIATISGGATHMLALCADGTLAAWGENTSDQLGNGINNSSFETTSVALPGLVSMTRLPTGSRFMQATSGSASSFSLGIVALAAPLPAAPRLAVEQPAGTNLVSGDFGLDFGYLARGAAASRTLTLRNTGSAALKISSITLTGPGRSSFAITRGPGTSIAAGSYANLILTCRSSDGNSGTSSYVHIASNDPTAPLFDVFLTVNWSGDSPAIISAGPGSVLVGAGQPTILLVDARGGGLQYEWLKDNVILPGVTQSSYSIAPASLSNAGTYTVRVSNMIGGGASSANVGVVNLAPTSVTIATNHTLVLTASAAGPSLTYQWRKGGTPLIDGTNPVNTQGSISGARTPTLAISNPVAADAGSYTCLITMPDAGRIEEPLQLASGVFTVKSSLRPALDAFKPSTWVVGTAVADVVTAKNNPTTFSVTGLPAGVTVDARTGKFAGKPSVPVTMPTAYHLTISARNAFGASSPLEVDATVQPLPDNAIGVFSGLVDRDTVLNNGFGGTFSLTTLSSGVFTGKLALGSLSYAFAAQGFDAGAAAPVSTVVIPRSPAQPSLTLTFTIDPATGEVSGSLTDGSVAPVGVHAWRNPWSASHPCFLAATYTSGLALDASLAGNATYPQGTGYGTLTISSAGSATWIGKMADGAATTRTTTVGGTGAVPLNFMLYANKGSAQGWATASAGTPANNGLRTLDGSLDWMKSANSDRAYGAGFPLHTLTIIGGESVRPTPGSPMLGLANTANNAALVFSGANIESAAAYSSAGLNSFVFTLTSANLVTLPPAAANPAVLSLTLSAPTGAFSGTFHLMGDADVTHSGVLLSRLVSYSGLLVPRLSLNQGVGYFLLAQLPTAGPPATTISTSPILSGNVVLKAAVQK